MMIILCLVFFKEIKIKFDTCDIELNLTEMRSIPGLETLYTPNDMNTHVKTKPVFIYL